MLVGGTSPEHVDLAFSAICQLLSPCLCTLRGRCCLVAAKTSQGKEKTRIKADEVHQRPSTRTLPRIPACQVASAWKLAPVHGSLRKCMEASRQKGDKTAMGWLQAPGRDGTRLPPVGCRRPAKRGRGFHGLAAGTRHEGGRLLWVGLDGQNDPPVRRSWCSLTSGRKGTRPPWVCRRRQAERGQDSVLWVGLDGQNDPPAGRSWCTLTSLQKGSTVMQPLLPFQGSLPCRIWELPGLLEGPRGGGIHEQSAPPTTGLSARVLQLLCVKWYVGLYTAS